MRSYIKKVKKNMNYFLLPLALVFLLVTVIVVSSFSFCHDDLGPKYSLSFEKNYSVSLQETHSDFQGNAKTTDSCSGGFCHLGHCSSVVVPYVSHFYVKIESSICFVILTIKPADRFLEGPFHPPKFA